MWVTQRNVDSADGFGRAEGVIMAPWEESCLDAL